MLVSSRPLETKRIEENTGPKEGAIFALDRGQLIMVRVIIYCDM
jgi:hypothetical protein